MGAVERLSACASVFAAMNSTPGSPFPIMCSTALPPHPPTPITLITASCGLWSMISNMMCSFSCLIAKVNSNVYARAGWLVGCLSCTTPTWRGDVLHRRPHAISKIRLEPLPHPFRDIAQALALCARQFRAQELFSPVEQQADRSGVAWTAHDVRQSADIRRDADAYGKVKHFLAQLDHPLQQCRTAGKDDARREQLLEAAATQLRLRERVGLLDPRLDHLRQHLP